MRGDGVKRAGHCGVGGYQGYQNIGRGVKEGGDGRKEIVGVEEGRLIFFFFFIIERTGFYLQIRRQRKRREETVRQEGPQSAWICTIFPPTRWLSQTITEQEGSGEPAER